MDLTAQIDTLLADLGVLPLRKHLQIMFKAARLYDPVKPARIHEYRIQLKLSGRSRTYSRRLRARKRYSLAEWHS